MRLNDKHDVRAWSFGEDVVLEWYRYAPGAAAELPKHSHEEYQIGLSLNFPGVYGYRGESHAVPVGSLGVIHPGESHSACDPMDRPTVTEYRTMYVSPRVLEEAASDVAGRAVNPPFFPAPVLSDGGLAGRFLGLHAASGAGVSRLEQDSRFLSLLAELVARHAEAGLRSGFVGSERRAVKEAREYLEDNLAENVSLRELSGVAHLSPYHLSRVFKQEVGVPPHTYQLQARLARAKGLLLRGWPASRVAFETGFADQNHLARHFKRLVGVPPGSYSRNGEDPPAADA